MQARLRGLVRHLTPAQTDPLLDGDDNNRRRNNPNARIYRAGRQAS
jgi:hypothetical protein